MLRRLAPGDKGADVNASRKNGTTSLHLAAELNRMAIAKLLIEAGADRNATIMGSVTPIMLADGNHHEEMSAYLKALGGGTGELRETGSE